MTDDMYIVFDMDEVLKVMTPIEHNYCDFLDLSGSFLGWLLTLNAEEFALVHKSMNHDFKKDPNGATSFLFPMIELRHIGKAGILYGELVYINHQQRGKTNLIHMVKEGFLTYKTADKDLDWEFKLTEKGAKYKKELEDNLEKEKNGRTD